LSPKSLISIFKKKLAPSPLKAPPKPVVKRKKGNSIVNPHSKRQKPQVADFDSD